MKRIIGLLVVALLAFYVAWPAWSGYSIKSALQAQDPVGLAAKIDFDRVRQSLRPAITRKVDDGVDRYQAQLGGAAGMIIGQLRKELVPKIVDASINRLLTPAAVIRIAAEGGSVKESLDRIMREQIGRGVPGGGAPAEGAADPRPQSKGLGGLLGKVLKDGAGPMTNDQRSPDALPSPTPTAPATERKYSLSNIKSFTIDGPLSFRVGVAKDPAATVPDVTAEMAFTGGDWKVVGLVPRL
ncbi:MAG: DUF2939 domain-containing protein [Hyphomicrobiaceae bacterium]